MEFGRDLVIVTGISISMSLRLARPRQQAPEMGTYYRSLQEEKVATVVVDP